MARSQSGRRTQGWIRREGREGVGVLYAEGCLGACILVFDKWGDWRRGMEDVEGVDRNEPVA